MYHTYDCLCKEFLKKLASKGDKKALLELEKRKNTPAKIVKKSKRKNSEKLVIGHPQVCPICGKSHRDDEDFVYCAEHRYMFNKVNECDIFTDESPILSSEIRENWEKKLDDVRTRRDRRNGDFF